MTANNGIETIKTIEFKSKVREKMQEKRKQRQEVELQQKQQKMLIRNVRDKKKRARTQRSRDGDDSDSDNGEDDFSDYPEFQEALGLKKQKTSHFNEQTDDVADNSDDSDEDEDDEYDQRQVRTALRSLARESAMGDESDEEEAEEEENTTVVVSNLPGSFLSRDDIRSFFSQISEVSRLEVDRNRSTAYIQFLSQETSELICRELDYILVGGRCLRLKMSELTPSEQERSIWKPLAEWWKSNTFRERDTRHLKNCTYFTLPGPHQLVDAAKMRDRELALERHYSRVHMVRNRENIAYMKEDVRERMVEDMKKWQAQGIDYDYDGL